VGRLRIPDPPGTKIRGSVNCLFHIICMGNYAYVLDAHFISKIIYKYKLTTNKMKSNLKLKD
jgi:hypothetical protein